MVSAGQLLYLQTLRQLLLELPQPFTPGLPWDAIDNPPKTQVLIEIEDEHHRASTIWVCLSHDLPLRSRVCLKRHKCKNAVGFGAVAVIFNKVPSGWLPKKYEDVFEPDYSSKTAGATGSPGIT